MKPMKYTRNRSIITDHTGEKPVVTNYSEQTYIGSGVNKAKAESHRLQMDLDGGLGRGSVRLWRR